MSRPVWNGHAGQRERDLNRFIRAECITAQQGLVVEDVDLVLRRYDPQVLGDRGRFRLVENKKVTSPMPYGQLKTFRLIDELLRAANSDRYDGFYLVETPDPWDDAGPFYVNDVPLDRFEFTAWCEFADDAPSIAPCWVEGGYIPVWRQRDGVPTERRGA